MIKNFYEETISASRYTPLVLFKKLNGCALLESALLEEGKSRYSIIVLEEAFRLLLKERGIIEKIGNIEKIISDDKTQFLQILKKYYQDDLLQKVNPSYPVPTRGLGYLSYETCRYFDDIKMEKQADLLGIPEAAFVFGNAFAVFDHYKEEIHLLVLKYPFQSFNPQQKIQDIKARIEDADYRAYQTDEAKYQYKVNDLTSEKVFTEQVGIIKEEIVKGNLLQCVLSRISILESALPPLEAYCRLRRENPSPYLFYLDFGDFKLFGSSPEVMVKVNDRHALIKPIAGTRHRGKTAEEDRLLAVELIEDEKERAEHLMLIDLARNDLGRTEKRSSVKVVESFNIEKYANVMHIVSQIESDIAPEYDVFDVIKTTLPAGTLSGAPKIRAIETLSSLEEYKRIPYGGLVGYFDAEGNFDSCIAIRSAVYQNKKFYIQVGAGIVYDSDPQKEYQETIYKAQSLFRALGVSK